MFKKSRRKIVLSIMIPLILLFAVSLGVILAASYHDIRRDGTEMLQQYTESYSMMQQPGGPGNAKEPDRGNDRQMRNERNYELSTFYAVTFTADGTVLSVDDGDRSVYSEEELTELATEALNSGKSSGRTGELTWQVVRGENYTLVAFLDNTVSDGSLDTLVRNFLIVGGAALVLLFFLSLYVSKLIIRPLEENDRMQKQFISDASHELKTPVSVISANAELLTRELGQNEWLANIQYENERMGGLIRQLLNLSRAENTGTAMEPADFSRIVTGETLTLESLAFEQGKTIVSDIEEDLTVTGNTQQLSQLVTILLDNAIRHSTGEEISLCLKRQNRAAVLSVSNAGDEIPPEKLAHLFDRFYRVDEARTGDEQHYGLGLSIAKAITEGHGGKIGVTCADGTVCFTASIPLKN